MKKNLFDFADENLEDEKKNIKEEKTKKEENNILKDAKNLDNNIKQEASNLYNKYKNFSQEELLNEFLTTSKQKIKQGSLSKESLNKTLNAISPYITSEQKAYFDNLINSLDD